MKRKKILKDIIFWTVAITYPVLLAVLAVILYCFSIVFAIY